MLKFIGPLCASIVSAAFLAIPVEARDRIDRICGHAVELNTIVGADVSDIVGNAMPRKDCGHEFHYNRARYDTVRYGRANSWRDSGTGGYRGIRIIRTYYDNGYWEVGRWHASADAYRDNRRADYRRTMCKEYSATSRRPGRFSETHVACLDGNGTWRVVS